MRIGNFREDRRNGWQRVSADIVWEEARRPAQTVFFASPAPHGRDLAPGAHAFLLAAAIPALRRGEARVQVEGRICPRLQEGLVRAMRLLSEWHAPRRRIPRVEATEGLAPPPPEGRRRALFLSGGVDSLALLHADLHADGAAHRERLRDAFCVEGFDLYWRPDQRRTDLFERTLASLAPIAHEAGVDLIPVRTNLRDLDSGWAWLREWLAAGTSAVAHAFDRRVGRVAIASSAHEGDAVPLGTHPALDPLYSSASLAVRHEGSHERRIDKVARVAGWDTALRALRVCYQMEALSRSPRFNCGRCHKCVLTMLELVAVGRLEACPTFEANDVRPEMTNALRPTSASSLGYFRELLEPLRARGRADLAAAVAHKIATHEEFERRRRHRPWWSRLRRGHMRRLDAWAWERARVDHSGAPVRP